MDTNRNNGKGNTYIVGDDEFGNTRRAQVIQRGDGINAQAIDGTVTVSSSFGSDPLPDSWFRIVDTGDENDTLTVFIAATSNDPSSPDRDLPSYTKIFTIEAGEVGDELALRDRIVSELNLDSAFKDNSKLKALAVQDRSIVHISSTLYSLEGDFYERINSGDFDVTTTGNCSVVVGFDNLISRSKPVVLDRDPNNPHRSGVFGISGSVSISPRSLDAIHVVYATHSTYGNNLLQAGSLGTPIKFYVDADAEDQIFIESMIFSGNGNGIKFDQFLSKSGAGGLTNGVLVTVKSDNVVTTFPVVKTTEGFKNKWAALSGTAANFSIDLQSGKDEFVAVLSFSNPFVIQPQGTFGTVGHPGTGDDDYIEVKIQDDISSGVSRFDFLTKGFGRTI